MMGRQRRDQGQLFYEFRLEDRIPENHLLRRMNVFDCRAPKTIPGCISRSTAKRPRLVGWDLLRPTRPASP